MGYSSWGHKESDMTEQQNTMILCIIVSKYQSTMINQNGTERLKGLSTPWYKNLGTTGDE